MVYRSAGSPDGSGRWGDGEVHFLAIGLIDIGISFPHSLSLSLSAILIFLTHPHIPLHSPCLAADYA